MKSKLAIATLFSGAALLTPAEATTVLFNTSTLTNGNYAQGYNATLPGSAGTVGLYGFDGVFSAPAPPATVSVNNGHPDSPVSTSGQGTSEGGAGLGVHNGGTPYIGPGDAVVLDFSGLSSTIKNNETQVQFNMTIDANGPSYWVVYGYNTSSGKYILLGDDPMELPTKQNGLTGTYSGTPTLQTSAIYSQYLIGITNDCDLTINSVQITYNNQSTQSTPEPGTFVMAGMALVAVGVTMKKRNRKA